MGSFQFRSRDRSWNIHLKLDRSNFRQVFSRVNFSIFVAGNLATSETKVWFRRRKRWRLRETVYEERFLPWKKGIENSSKRIKRSFDGVSRIETKFSIGIFSKTFRKVSPSCSENESKSSTLNNFSRNCCSWWHFLAEKKKKNSCTKRRKEKFEESFELLYLFDFQSGEYSLFPPQGGGRISRMADWCREEARHSSLSREEGSGGGGPEGAARRGERKKGTARVGRYSVGRRDDKET